jgi:hypothetical protein
MRKTVMLALVAAGFLVLAMGAPAQEKGKGFLWDGNFWKQLSMDAKLGYIGGIGNLADFEMAASKGKAFCVSQTFAEELKHKTPLAIVEEVDKFYQENPGKLNTSVIEVVLRRCTTVCPPEAPSGEKKN